MKICGSVPFSFFFISIFCPGKGNIYYEIIENENWGEYLIVDNYFLQFLAKYDLLEQNVQQKSCSLKKIYFFSLFIFISFAKIIQRISI